MGSDRNSRWGVNSIAILFTLSSVFVAGCGSGKPPAAGPAKTPRQYNVRTDLVKTQLVKYELETTGTIQAQDIYRIDAQVSGTIYDVSFREGDLVKRDTMLCRIAPLGYKLAAMKAEGEYKKAVADLADTERRVKNSILNAEVSLQEAEIEVTRRRTVRAVGAISEEEVQLYQAKRDLAEIHLKDMKDAAQTMVEVMRTAILEKEAAMKIAQDDLRKSTVLPPMEGQIEQRMVTNGNFVTSGTPLAILVNLGSLKLKFTLPEDQAPHIRPGAEVAFRVPGYPDRDLTASVYYVGDLADQSTRLVTCWANVERTDANLKGGFFATIRIVTTENKQAIVIPMTALLPTEHGFVSYVVQDGKAVRRKVETGLHVVDRAVEILSGLKEGETIVVEGANSLQDGVPVKDLGKKPVEEKSQAGEVTAKENTISTLPGDDSIVNSEKEMIELGGRSSEPTGGYSIQPPKGWTIREFPGFKYQIVVGPTEESFALNIGVVTEKAPVTLESYFQDNVKILQAALKDGEIKKTGQILLNDGTKGFFVVHESNKEKQRLKQVQYFLEKGDTKYVITGSALATNFDKWRSSLESSMKSFQFAP